MKFQTRSISELGDAVMLFPGFPTSRTTDTDGIPCYSVAALRNSEAPKYYASESEFDRLGQRVARTLDVLISVEGSVGESIVVTDEMGTFVPSQQAAGIRVMDQSIVDPWYLASWLNTEQGRLSLAQLSQGAGIPRIPFRNLQSLRLPLPDLAAQSFIGERYRIIMSSISSHFEAAARLQDLLTAEMDLIFTSEEE